ncbi:hypothetical protein Tco_0242461 [Tanacetum coccineum]
MAMEQELRFKTAELWFRWPLEDTCEVIKEDHFRGTMPRGNNVALGMLEGQNRGGMENRVTNYDDECDKSNRERLALHVESYLLEADNVMHSFEALIVGKKRGENVEGGEEREKGGDVRCAGALEVYAGPGLARLPAVFWGICWERSGRCGVRVFIGDVVVPPCIDLSDLMLFALPSSIFTTVPLPSSLVVNTSTEASGSKPRSNTKKNRILPAKSENEKKVEDHPRTNKSVWTKVNRVDLSLSLISCSMNANPTVKIILNNGKQIWKPKGKLSHNRLNKTKRVWKAMDKLIADIGYQWRPTRKTSTLGKLNCGYQWRPTGKKFALGKLNCGPQQNLGNRNSKPSKLDCFQMQYRTCGPLVICTQACSKHMMGKSFKAQDFVEKSSGHRVRFWDSHFGAIIGYGDYVIGDSVISRVYYVEGLGHNLFSTYLYSSRNTNLIHNIAWNIRVKSSPYACYLLEVYTRMKLKKIIFAQPVTMKKDKKSPTNQKSEHHMEFSHNLPHGIYGGPEVQSSGSNLDSGQCNHNAPSTSFSPSSSGIQPLVIQRDVAIGPTNEDTPITQATLHLSNNPITGEPGSAQSSSGDVRMAEPNQVTQPPDHLRKWSKDHPLDNIVGNPSRPTRSMRKTSIQEKKYDREDAQFLEIDGLAVLKKQRSTHMNILQQRLNTLFMSGCCGSNPFG